MQVFHISVVCHTIPRCRTLKKYKHRISGRSACWDLLSFVGIYNRPGIPEKILSDMGSQFVTECIDDVTRLLNVRQLANAPYNPMCNGLVEKFNGTLKAMLKPRQRHRYVDLLLFA